MRKLWRKLKDLVVHKILGVDDTPHRIAWGVFLGFVVAWTPTLGFQILLYVATATLLRANKLSGIPILFISNPFTAVPVYYFAWMVGAFLLRGGSIDGAEGESVVRGSLEASAGHEDWMSQVFSSAFWTRLGETLLEMGGELWLGSFVVGVVTGAMGYFVTLWAVRAFRRAKGR